MIESITPPAAPAGGPGLPGFAAVPDAQGRMVGPFAFMAAFGPIDLAPGFSHEFDVRAHPHIGASILFVPFDGESTHRDNLGNARVTRAGEASWMTCGSGIVHSERMERLRRDGGRLAGLVAFVALPEEAEDCSPAFRHLSADDIPTIQLPGAHGRLLLGSAHGKRSPAELHSPAYLIDWQLDVAAELCVWPVMPERALFVVSGSIRCARQRFGPGTMLTLTPDAPAILRASEKTRLIEFGGVSVGERFRWWNYVTSRPQAIEAAKRAWARDDRDMPFDEREFTPLPADDERPLIRLRPGASAAARATYPPLVA